MVQMLTVATPPPRPDKEGGVKPLRGGGLSLWVEGPPPPPPRRDKRPSSERLLAGVQRHSSSRSTASEGSKRRVPPSRRGWPPPPPPYEARLTPPAPSTAASLLRLVLPFSSSRERRNSRLSRSSPAREVPVPFPQRSAPPVPLGGPGDRVSLASVSSGSLAGHTYEQVPFFCLKEDADGDLCIPGEVRAVRRPSRRRKKSRSQGTSMRDRSPHPRQCVSISLPQRGPFFTSDLNIDGACGGSREGNRSSCCLAPCQEKSSLRICVSPAGGGGGEDRVASSGRRAATPVNFVEGLEVEGEFEGEPPPAPHTSPDRRGYGDAFERCFFPVGEADWEVISAPCRCLLSRFFIGVFCRRPRPPPPAPGFDLGARPPGWGGVRFTRLSLARSTLFLRSRWGVSVTGWRARCAGSRRPFRSAWGLRR